MQVLLSIITPGITSLILLLVKSGRLSPLLHEPVNGVHVHCSITYLYSGFKSW